MLSKDKNNNPVVTRSLPRPRRGYAPTFVAIIVLALSLVGCSATEQSAGGSESAASSTPQAADMKAAVNSGTPPATRVPQNRAVVRKASLSVRVPDAEKAEKDVTRYVAGLGGFVSGSTSTDLSSSSPTVTMTVRVPASEFDRSLEQFVSMGRCLQKQVSGEDVTAQLVDFEARLKMMRAQEDSFRNMLRTSNRSTESLDLQTRLMKLREEIESLAAQRKALSDLASLSTVELTLVGEVKDAAKTKDKGWAKESWSAATSSFASVAQGIGSLGIYLLVFSPAWVPTVLFFWWLARKGTKAGSQKA